VTERVTLTADEIKKRLGLEPLPAEGGFFRETYRSTLAVDGGEGFAARSASSAIYYLLTPDTFSAVHRLPFHEVFHFYLGDPVEMLQLYPDGSSKRVLIGNDLARDMQPQVIVPGWVWQGTRLVPGGKFALLGTTMAPGFDFKDFELGDRARLLREYPDATAMIEALTRIG